jgi:hypothetical protein
MIAVRRIERHHQEVMADDTLLIGDKREKTFAGDLRVDAAPAFYQARGLSRRGI